MANVSSAANDALMRYMRQQNRPYSVQNVFDNLRGEIPKPKIGPILDAFVDTGILVAKSYGAQKIYCVKQESSASPAESVETKSLAELRASIVIAQEGISSVSKSLEILKSRFTAHNQAQSAVTRMRQLKGLVLDLDSKINSLISQNPSPASTSNIIPYSGDDLKKLLAQVTDQAVKRRRIAGEMIHYVSEACCSSKRDVVDDLGLETEDSFPNK